MDLNKMKFILDAAVVQQVQNPLKNNYVGSVRDDIEEGNLTEKIGNKFLHIR